MNRPLSKELITFINYLSQENYNQLDLNFSSIPEKELRAFFEGLKNLPKITSSFELKNLSKEDLERGSLTYLFIHDLYHKSIKGDNLLLLETEITLLSFKEIENVLNNNQKSLIQSSYLLLSLATLNNFHQLEHLISEKIILGESYFYGVFDISLWGYRIDNQKFSEVIENLYQKLKNNSLDKIINRYKNFVPDLSKLKQVR